MSFDMGGTTAKLCLIEDGRPLVTHEFEAARTDRFTRGSGLPIKTPTIDMIEIGVGGGSLAHVDTLGLLACGPESAGADPGPACYGGGGTRPTVTDADLVLGYLDPGFFLGGEMTPRRRGGENRDPRPTSPSRSASPSRRPRGASTGSSTRTWPAPRACTPPSAATTRPACRCSRSAAPARCTRSASAPRSAPTTVIVPAAAGVMSSVGVLAAPLATDAVRSRARARRRRRRVARVEPLFAELEQEAPRSSPLRRRHHARALDRHALRRPGLRGDRARDARRGPARTRSRPRTCAPTAASARTSRSRPSAGAC